MGLVYHLEFASIFVTCSNGNYRLLITKVSQIESLIVKWSPDVVRESYWLCLLLFHFVFVLAAAHFGTLAPHLLKA